MRYAGVLWLSAVLTSLMVLTACGPESNTGTNSPSGKQASNKLPVAVISPATEQFILVGETIDFRGDESFDPDGDAPLSYDWAFSGAISSIRRSRKQNPGVVSFTRAGVAEVTLYVTDDSDAESDATSVTVHVDEPGVNRAPNAEIIHKLGAGAEAGGDFSIVTGSAVLFTANASDADGDAITDYQWSFPANVTVPATPGGGAFTATFPAAGSYVITLTVTDAQGNTDPTPARITVNVTDTPPANQAPNGSISHDGGNGTAGSSGNLSVVAGANVVFTGSAVDPEGDPVSYSWNFSAGVNAPASPGAGPFTVSFPTAGSYSVSLTVSDNQGNTDPTPARITVNVTDTPPANQAPNGSISHDGGNGAAGSSGDLTIVTGTNVVFTGSAVDPDGDPVTYAWTFNGVNASATTGSGPITVSYTTPGTYTVELTVSDNQGNSDPSPAVVSVQVGQPEFQFLPVLDDEDGNPNDAQATYSLTADAGVAVKVVTPNGSWQTPMMRYNGLQLPPVIKAKRGTQMSVNVKNNLGEATTVHWHGFKIPAIEDGGPDNPIAAGVSRTYRFTLAQAAGPLWFHPHAHGTTATQVYNGLAGGFIVTDDISASLESGRQIPAGAYDIPMLIQDRRFAADNGSGTRALAYQANVAGMLGDHVLINGVEMPGLRVETRQYRFRLFNGSNARTYDIALGDGRVFNIVATDGGLLNTPVPSNHVMLGAGERAEIVVNFGAYAPGDSVLLVSRAFSAVGPGGGGSLANGAAFNMMRFDVTTAVTDDVVLYTALPTNADINTRLTAADASVTRSFVMSMNMVMGQGMRFLINGRSFDITRVDERVASGATEIWDISNTSPMAHPFHAHAIQWQILDRNGVPASGIDLGWKDTVLVQPNERVRFIGRFDPVINKGKYMYHCHILEHEEAGMMGIFEVQ